MKVLIADEVHPLLIEGLIQFGYTVLYMPEIDRQGIIEKLPDVVGLIVRTKTTIDKSVLLHAGKLKWIARAGAGLDNIDTEWCEIKHIACIHASGANAQSVGEHATGMLLSLLHKINKANEEVKQGVWNRNDNNGRELHTKTVGIIGYGNTGKAFARCLSGIGPSVLAYDAFLSDFTDAYATESSLKQIQLKADIVSFHVPLTSATRHYFNQAFLEQFAKPILIINTSRGAVVDTHSLVNGLKSGKIWGCALDVLEEEPLTSQTVQTNSSVSFLVNHPSVLFTPHVAGWSIESFEAISKVLLQKIKELNVG